GGVAHVYGDTPAVYSTDLLAARAVDFVRAHAHEPFFLYYAPFAPHAPATPAARHRGSYADLPPWRPPSFNEADTSDKPAWVVARMLDFLRRGEPETVRDPFRIDQLESLR